VTARQLWRAARIVAADAAQQTVRGAAQAVAVVADTVLARCWPIDVLPVLDGRLGSSSRGGASARRPRGTP